MNWFGILIETVHSHVTEAVQTETTTKLSIKMCANLKIKAFQSSRFFQIMPALKYQKSTLY